MCIGRMCVRRTVVRVGLACPSGKTKGLFLNTSVDFCDVVLELFLFCCTCHEMVLLCFVRNKKTSI